MPEIRTRTKSTVDMKKNPRIWRKSSPSLIDLFDAVIPKDARIERRMMFGYPAAFLNGHLFAGLHQENFILKLSPVDRDQLTMECNIPAFEPIPGRAMHEYRALPASALADRRTLAAWLARSMAYVAAKPPKPKKVVTPKSRMPRRR